MPRRQRRSVVQDTIPALLCRCGRTVLVDDLVWHDCLDTRPLPRCQGEWS